MSARIIDKKGPYRPNRIEIKLDFSHDLAELEYTEYLTYMSKDEWEKSKKITGKRISAYLKKKLPKGWSVSVEPGDRSWALKVKGSKVAILAGLFSELGMLVSSDEAIRLIEAFCRSRDSMSELGR